MYPIVSCIITYNSKSAVTVTMASDREYWVKQYSLENYVITFEEKIGGLPTSYIKLKEVEQNSKGTYFAITYLDDGIFKLRTFGETTRTEDQIHMDEFNINEALGGMNNHTMPINNFPDPFISCCFVTDELIYVNLFHNDTLTHHHFFYNTKTREISRHTNINRNYNNENSQCSPKHDPNINYPHNTAFAIKSLLVPLSLICWIYVEHS